MEPGTKLGPYEITEQLGAGGMGEVYRARDTSLDRDVAIKVLPEDFASDAVRLARFEREAKLLASLNHPNIATIHGFDESDGVRFIAMELIEGQSLAERIEASGRIDVDEALEIARRIALALEAAHEAGVIHRDLKPANVQVAPDGTVKVLDFGLAKAYEAEGGDPSSDLSHSPTMMAATGTGVIMGTAPYMSPEQARGLPVDKRTDIWSFGCVLYEMLTGKAAFGGKTVSDVIAAIIEREPAWEAVPRATPAIVQHVLRRCLEKDPSQRLRDIGDARIEIMNTMAGSDVGVGLTAGRAEATRPSWLRAIPTPVALAMAATTAVAAWVLSGPGGEPREAVVVARSSIATSADVRLQHAVAPSPLAIAPDGTHLVYVGVDDGISRLYLRPIHGLSATPLNGTEGAYGPFFSPDSEWSALPPMAGC